MGYKTFLVVGSGCGESSSVWKFGVRMKGGPGMWQVMRIQGAGYGGLSGCCSVVFNRTGDLFGVVANCGGDMCECVGR
jgi:hypothetical protein